MDYFAQQLINGLTLGSIYGLIAIGYTMVYGIVGMINFAHGEVFYDRSVHRPDRHSLAFLDLDHLRAGRTPCRADRLHGRDRRLGVEHRAHSLPPAQIVLSARAFDHGHRHVHHASELRADCARRALEAPAPLIRGGFTLADSDGFSVNLSYVQILIIATTVVLMAAFSLIISRTALGRAQRACEQDRKMAALCGVNVDRTISLTFVIGAALAAVAGLMFLVYYGVIDFFVGFVAGIKAFTAAVLGGIGSLPGAMLGGLAIGLIEVFWAGYFTAQYKDVAAFSILAIVLIFMPSGLLGRPEVEKV